MLRLFRDYLRIAFRANPSKGKTLRHSRWKLAENELEASRRKAGRSDLG
jgi:hypothetical protein